MTYSERERERFVHCVSDTYDDDDELMMMMLMMMMMMTII